MSTFLSFISAEGRVGDGEVEKLDEKLDYIFLR